MRALKEALSKYECDTSYFLQEDKSCESLGVDDI
jgi:hypothetical protein